MRYLNRISVVIITLALVLSVVGVSVVLIVGESSSPYTLLRYDERRSGQAPLVGDLTDPKIRWTYDRPGSILTSPTVADINDDGKNEVVFGGTDGRITALDENGNLIWEIQAKATSSAGTVGDVDGDGKQEVIITELHHWTTDDLGIIVLNGEDGSEVWRFTPAGFPERGFASTPILEDITGDGINDILVGSMIYKFYALDGPTGAVLWSSDYEHFIRSASPMADMDLDGENEIIGIDNHAIAKSFDATTGAVEWEGDLGACVGSTPAIGDLDGDGYGEAVFSMCTSGGIVVLNHDGSVLWQRPEHTLYYASPTLIDVDNDGLEDVVNTAGGIHTVLAYKGTNGDLIWSTVLPDTIWAQGSPVSVDIDGDGDIEILVGSDSGLYSLNAQDGALEWYFPTGEIVGESFVVDLEKQGGAEVVYTSGSTVYVLEQKYRKVLMCLRVEGRKWNTVEAIFLEDGVPVDSLKVTRVPGDPKEQMQCTILKVSDESSYSVQLKYISDGVGANPVKLIIGDGDDITRLKFLFNSQKGLVQEITESLDSVL